MMEAAIHIKPFGFDRVFRMGGGAEPPKASDAGEIEEEPIANEEAEELKAQIARMVQMHAEELARARTDGFEAGLWQARQEREVALLAAVDALHAALDDVDERLVEEAQALSHDAACVAMAAAEAIAGHAVMRDPARAIDEAIDRVLRQVRRGTQIMVRVHPDLAGDIEARIVERQAKDRRKLSISVISDADVAIGDAQIVWEEGGLCVDAAARRAAVMAELGPLLGDGKNGIDQEKDSAPATIA